MQQKFILIIVFILYQLWTLGQESLEINKSIHPPTLKILDQVYLIQSDTLSGTCFAVDYNNEEYLVTARHIFRRLIKSDTSVFIKLYVKGRISDYTAKFYTHKNPSIDIAVLKLNDKINKKESYPLTGHIVIGQDVYFLGYPTFGGHIFYTQSHSEIFPFIKRAIVSASVNINDTTSIMFLDGQNNPGFSGGPIMYYDYFDNKHKIIGIISGYYLQEANLDTTSYKYYENSGIIKGYYIKQAVEIIENITN